jgi:hypothetical protein
MSISWEIPRLRFFLYTLYYYNKNDNNNSLQHM